ncbi:MAG: DNA-3-methyladenine glycosylase 2 family protein [Bacteroidota bacterium]
MTLDPLPYDIAEAEAHLRAADPRLSALIDEIGPGANGFGLRAMETVPALVRAITYQQLSTKAAGTIHGRVLDLLGEEPTPEAILAQTDETLRSCGLSRQKTAAVQDLARLAQDVIVPTRTELAAMPDEEVIQRLVTVRGVGVWTARMFLLFTLGRPDVWAPGDLGLREGLRVMLGAEERPTPKEFEVAGEPFRPWRSVASWYLWRATELGR